MADKATIEPPKQAALKLVDRLREDVTFDEIIYELYVLEKIHRGKKDAEEDRTATHEEVKQKLDNWLA